MANKLVIGLGISVLVLGIVIMIIGAALRVYTETTETWYGVPITEKPYADEGEMLFNGGLVMFALGCVLTTVGAIVKSSTRRADKLEARLSATGEKSVRFCRHCGEEVEADSTYCGYCGRRF